VDEWYDVVGGTGQVNIQVDFKPSNVSLWDFSQLALGF
jgi:hypothetical protein